MKAPIYLLVGALLFAASCGDSTGHSDGPERLFVQTSDGAVLTDSRLALTGVSRQTGWFTDRPNPRLRRSRHWRRRPAYGFDLRCRCPSLYRLKPFSSRIVLRPLANFQEHVQLESQYTALPESIVRQSFLDAGRYKWREVIGDPDLSYKVRHDSTILGHDQNARTLDMVMRWKADGGHCPIHRHTATTTVLVLEGEQHLWGIHLDGRRGDHTVRTAGGAPATPPGFQHPAGVLVSPGKPGESSIS